MSRAHFFSVDEDRQQHGEEGQNHEQHHDVHVPFREVVLAAERQRRQKEEDGLKHIKLS